MEELDFILANLHKELEKQRIKALRNIESEKIDDSQNIFLRAFNNFGIDGVKEINVMYAHALAERTLYELGLKSTHDLAEILISTCAKTQNQKDSITSTNEIQIAR